MESDKTKFTNRINAIIEEEVKEFLKAIATSKYTVQPAYPLQHKNSNDLL